MRSTTLTLAILVLSHGALRLSSQSPPAAVVAPVFGVHPGRTTKAEVDLRLGEPARKLEAEAGVRSQAYEYLPPREAPEAERVIASYFTDTWQVARIDVRLKSPMPADALREQFGTRIVARDIRGGREELFYPRLQGLLLANAREDAAVSAISYISPRWLADYYIESFYEHNRAQRLDEARFAAEKAVIIAPDYAGGYVAQGIYFWKAKNPTEAKVRFLAGTNATTGPFAKALAHMWLGRFHAEEEKKLAEAEVEYRKAIDEAPSLCEAHLKYGQFLAHQKRLNDATPELTKAVQLDPANMEARRNLVDVLHDRRQFAEEYTHLKALYDWLEGGGAPDTHLRALILRRYAEALWPGRGRPERAPFGKPQQAIEIYERAAQADPGDIWAFFSMGEIYRELGDPGRAVECFRSGLRRDPKSLDLQRSLGMALLENNRFAEARQVAEDSVALDPKSAAAQMVQVARAWSALRDKKRALLWLHKAVAGGYSDRQYLSADPLLAELHGNGDFKKMLERMQ